MSDEYAMGAVVVSAIAGLFGLSAKRNLKAVDDTLIRHSESIDDLQEKEAACQLSLANFKTEVAKDYAKETTMQNSLSRIHDRLDKLPTEIIHILQNGHK